MSQLRKSHIERLQQFVDMFQKMYEAQESRFNSWISSNKTIQGALGRAGVSNFKDLTKDEQRDLLSKMAETGDEQAKTMNSIYEFLESNRDKLLERQYELAKLKNESARDYGYMNPRERYEFQRKLISGAYARTHADRQLQANKLAELDTNEVNRLQVEMQNELLRIEDRKRELLLEQETIKQRMASLDSTKDAEALKEQNELLKQSIANYQSLDLNGTKTMRDLQLATQEAVNQQRESAKAAKEVSLEYVDAYREVGTEFFDKLLVQGESLEDCLNDLKKEIGHVAVKWFMNMFMGFPANYGMDSNNPWVRLLVNPQMEKGQVNPALTGNTSAVSANTQATYALTNALTGTGYRNVVNGTDGVPLAGGRALQSGALGSFNATGSYFPMGGTDYRQGFETMMAELKNPLGVLNQNLTQLTPNVMQTSTQLMNLGSYLPPLQAAQLANTQAQMLGITAQSANSAATLANTVSTTAGTTAEVANTTAVTAATTSMQTSAAMGKGKGMGGKGKAGAAGKAGKMMLGLKRGGEIPKYAGGGHIRGAGTGTSDSILTYLANRGQFIRTSDGEFIMSAKATDKIGVNTLNTLNEHPELFDEFILGGKVKGLATGGAVEMAPTMKPSTVRSFNSFHKAQAEINNPNSRMERLMEQQNGMLKGFGQRQDGRIVVLNTQADSQSVMKAIHDNPKAFKQLLGQQQKRGFR